MGVVLRGVFWLSSGGCLLDCSLGINLWGCLLEVFICPINQNATGVLYLDDGESFDHEKKSAYSLVDIEYNEDGELWVNYQRN